MYSYYFLWYLFVLCILFLWFTCVDLCLVKIENGFQVPCVYLIICVLSVLPLFGFCPKMLAEQELYQCLLHSSCVFHPPGLFCVWRGDCSHWMSSCFQGIGFGFYLSCLPDMIPLPHAKLAVVQLRTVHVMSPTPLHHVLNSSTSDIMLSQRHFCVGPPFGIQFETTASDWAAEQWQKMSCTSI